MSNIIVNEIEYCKIQVHYEADADTICSKKNEVVSKFKGKKVPGYRQDKVPLEAIKQHFRKEINEQLKQSLAEEAVYSTISEKNIKPFGRPMFSNVSLEISKLISLNGEQALPTFSCEFELFTQPEFELKDYKAFDLPKIHSPMSIEELSQKMLQDLRTRHGETVPYGADDFVQMGDTVIVDFKTIMDGNIIDELTGEGQLLNIGRINIPEFSESLLGMKAEEVREFDINMPADYKPEYAGKTLRFEVKLSTGSKTNLAPLNDDLAAKIGIQNYGILMDNIHSTAAARIQELEKNYAMDQIVKRLIANHDFKVPAWIALSEAQINAKSSNQDWDKISDEEKDKLITMAENSIKLSLILQKIRENEPEAQLTDEEVFQIAKENLSKHSQEPEKIMSELFKNGQISVFFNRIKDENTINFIEKTSKFVE